MMSDWGHLFFPVSGLNSFPSEDPQFLSQPPKVLATTPFISLQSSAAWEQSVPLLPFHHVSFILQLTEIQHWCPPQHWTDLVKGVASIWSSYLVELLCLSHLCYLMLLVIPAFSQLFLDSGDLTCFGFSAISLSVFRSLRWLLFLCFFLNNEML